MLLHSLSGPSDGSSSRRECSCRGECSGVAVKPTLRLGAWPSGVCASPPTTSKQQAERRPLAMIRRVSAGSAARSGYGSAELIHRISPFSRKPSLNNDPAYGAGPQVLCLVRWASCAREEYRSGGWVRVGWGYRSHADAWVLVFRLQVAGCFGRVVLRLRRLPHPFGQLAGWSKLAWAQQSSRGDRGPGSPGQTALSAARNLQNFGDPHNADPSAGRRSKRSASDTHVWRVGLR
eukprot:10876613-Alexandrium_andersonii.AAC.1